MNQEEFYSLEPDVRVDKINSMLKTCTLKEVAKEIGIPDSSFSKAMQSGDFVYIKRENKFFKFVRDINDVKTAEEREREDEEILFLKKNIDVLKSVISLYKGKTPLILSEKIYRKKGKYINKNLKMNDLLYKEFTVFCSEKFPTYRFQDLVAQSLIDFIRKYGDEA